MRYDKKRILRILVIYSAFIGFLLLGFALKAFQGDALNKTKEGNMKLTSVFLNGEKIPIIYTCDGDDVSPELTISEVPDNAKSLVLIVDDPDAPVGLFVHWILYNIPTSTTKISSEKVPHGAVAGMTDFGRIGYGGPCPPSGSHRYFFKLYAIDKVLDLPYGTTKTQLDYAINGHIIEKTQLIGMYSRK